MMLSDRDIQDSIHSGEMIIISPEDDVRPFNLSEQLQPSSIDLRLDNRFMRVRRGAGYVDICADEGQSMANYDAFQIDEGQPVVLHAHETLFGQVFEVMALPKSISGRIEGRSRYARLGLSVSATGGYINPGFQGVMPLQLINHTSNPVIVYPYVKICQLTFFRLTSEAVLGYMERSHTYGDESIASGYKPDTPPRKIPHEKYQRLLAIREGQLTHATEYDSRFDSLEGKILELRDILVGSGDSEPELEGELNDIIEQIPSAQSLDPAKRKSFFERIRTSVEKTSKSLGSVAEIKEHLDTLISSFFT